MEGNLIIPIATRSPPRPFCLQIAQISGLINKNIKHGKRLF